MTSVGGSETVCIAVLKTLVQDGHSVELLSSKIDKQLVDAHWDDVFSRLHLTRIAAPANRPFNTYPRYLILFKELLKLSPRKVDFLILTQELLPGITKIKARTTVLYVHFPYLSGIEDRGSSFVRDGYLVPLRQVIKSQLKHVNMILCNSKFTKNAILETWGNNNIPEPKVVYPAPLERPASNMGWDNRENRVLYVARFAPFKRHELLRDLARRMPHMEFVSAGSYSPAHKEYVRSLMINHPKNYSLRFNVSQRDLMELYATSRVYVHLAEAEHFGIAPVEAMASGCVTFAHDSGGPREFVPPYLRWREPSELQSKLEEVTTSKDSWDKWNNVCERSSEPFSFENFSGDLLDALSAQS